MHNSFIFQPQETFKEELSDERLLYNLNAEIRMQLRKNIDSAINIKLLLTDFKRSYPKLIDRLQKEIQRKAENYQPMNFNELANISNNTPSIQYRPVNKIPSINNISDDYNNINTYGSSGTNYASIKSTNQLLNTIIESSSNVTDKRDNEKIVDHSNEVSYNDITAENNETFDSNFNENDISTRIIHNNFIMDNVETVMINNNISPILKEQTCMLESVDELIYTENDVDMVLKERANNEIPDDPSQILIDAMDEDLDDTYSINSIDDVALMKETIDEINENLINDFFILTPPMEFRD